MNEQWCEKKQNQKVSHPLFFITEKEFCELSSNTIIVKNIKITQTSRNNRNVTYDIESMGSNLNLEKSPKNFISINLKQTKKNTFFIMIRSSELSKYHSLDLLQCNRKLAPGKKQNNKYVILLQCKDFSNYDLHPADFITQCDVNCMKKILDNQIRQQDAKHHGSSGCIYSFGHVAKYDKIKDDNLSFGKYATKMDKNELLKKRMLKNHAFLENKIYSQIHMGTMQLSHHLPNIFRVISPKISQMQAHYDLTTEDDTREKNIFSTKA